MPALASPKPVPSIYLLTILIPNGLQRQSRPPDRPEAKSQKPKAKSLLLPPQHLHHPLIIIHRVILNHNLPLAFPVPNPHPYPQHPLQV